MSLNQKPIFKTSSSLFLRLGIILAGLVLLVILLAQLTWFLGRWGQEQDIQHLETTLGTNIEASRVSTLSPGAAFRPMTKDEFCHMEGRVHTVGEWTKARIFNQSPMLRTAVDPVEDRLPKNPLVIHPPDQNGPYGGTWQRYGTSAPDIGIFPARLAYDGLVRWGPMAQQIFPNLAVKWEITDGGKTYTFWLREGVHWSNGMPFTVDDILFWYNHVIMNPELTPTIPREYQRDGIPMEVEKVNDHVVKFRFVSPYGLFLKVLASGRSYPMVEYPAHYLKKFHPDFIPKKQLMEMTEKESFDFWYQLFEDRASWQNTEVPRLWPWIIKVPPPAQLIVFERNPYYWKVDGDGNQLPYIDRMTFEIYDTEIINMKAMNGEMY